MSERDINFDYVLSLADEYEMHHQLEEIAVELLGKPSEYSAREMRENRLLSGDYAKISRTTIRNAGYVMGYSTLLELFVPEKTVYDAETDGPLLDMDDDNYDEDSDDILCYEGQSYSLTLDSYSTSLYKAQGFGALNINIFGDARLCLIGTFDSEEGEPNSSEAEIVAEMVSPLNVILASDVLRLYDARDILRSNI
ncbi:MAG: hypothetical protein WCJ60_01450 [bacterium]